MNHFFCILAFILTLTAGIAGYSKYSDLQRERNKLLAQNERVRDLQKKCKDMRVHIIKLRQNPRVIERELRKKLNWCKDGERVYHFQAVPDWN